MEYESFKKNGYIWPPRPEVKCPAVDLEKYDNGEFIGQPKLNGMAIVVFTNGVELEVYNRHKERMALLSNSKDIDFRGLATTGNWFVFAGEYLNKGQVGETGAIERNKFVLWEILVYNGRYLVGSTLGERLDLLETMFPCERTRITPDTMEIYDHLCWTKLDGIYKVPSYLGNFTELYNQIVKTPLYEGLLLKKKDSKLGYGTQERNNCDWQIKARRETKNYRF